MGKLYTFQMLEKAINDGNLEKFLLEVIDNTDMTKHKNEHQYYLGKNPTLEKLNNKLELSSTASGTSQTIALDPVTKIPNNFFQIIVKHIVSRMWKNGVTVNNDDEELDLPELFGKNYKKQLRKAASYSAQNGVSYVFYNRSELQVFKRTEYIPLPDARDNSHKAGIRFWTLEGHDETTIQLYEIDGWTEWVRDDSKGGLTVVQEKRAYTRLTPEGGEMFVALTPIVDGEPYKHFPIVPYYTNEEKQSELTPPIEARIDISAIKETFYMDEAIRMKFFMWTFVGFGGDVEKMIAMRKTMVAIGMISAPGVNNVEDVGIDGKALDIPYESHESTQARIEDEIYREAMLNIPTRGATKTAYEIRMGMIKEDSKMEGVESEAVDAVSRILEVAGIDYTDVIFKQATSSDDESTVRQLAQGVPDLPFEYQVKLNPAIPQEMEDAIIAAYNEMMIGMNVLLPPDDENDPLEGEE